MPRRTIFSDAELAGLFALPDTEAELIRRYTPSDTDLSIIAQHRPSQPSGFRRAALLHALSGPRARCR